MEILVAGALLDGVSFAKYDVVVLGGCHANEWVRMDVCMNGCVLLNESVGWWVLFSAYVFLYFAAA